MKNSPCQQYSFLENIADLYNKPSRFKTKATSIRIPMKNERYNVTAFIIKFRMYLIVMDYTILKYSNTTLMAQKKDSYSMQCESVRAAAFNDNSGIAVSKVFMDKKGKESNYYEIMALDSSVELMLDFIKWEPVQKPI